MANKITFLGTAGDSYVTGKQIRASGGIVINMGELQFHIDPGPGAVVRAVQNNINLRANTAVLVSNSSLLHCNDANAVIDAMTYGGQDKIGVLVSNQTFVNNGLSDLHRGYVERIIVMKKGQKLGVENVEVHALPAFNNDTDALGFKFLAPEFTLVYSSDTKYSKELVKEYQGADILILNVPVPGDEKSENQLNSEAVIKLVHGVNPKLVILTHFGVKMLKADPLYEGREIQKQTNVQVLVAKDGMSIAPGSYAAKSNQHRLSTFEQSEKKEEIQEEQSSPVKPHIEEIKEEVQVEEQQPIEEVSEVDESQQTQDLKSSSESQQAEISSEAETVEESSEEENHEEHQKHLDF